MSFFLFPRNGLPYLFWKLWLPVVKKFLILQKPFILDFGKTWLTMRQSRVQRVFIWRSVFMQSVLWWAYKVGGLVRKKAAFFLGCGSSLGEIFCMAGQ